MSNVVKPQKFVPTKLNDFTEVAYTTEPVYSQTCVKQPPKGSTKYGCLGQVKGCLTEVNKSRSEPGNAPRIGIGHREVVCQK